MADGAGLIGRIGHVAGRQRGGVPIRRGVAQIAVVRRGHLAGGVIGRPALQPRTGRTHVERQPRLVARIAGRADAGMRGLRHVHRPEAADHIVGGVWQVLQSVPVKAGMCGGVSTADFGLSLLL